LNPTLAAIDEWMRSRGLKLAHQKSEAIILSRRRVFMPNIGGPVQWKRRLLGTVVESQLLYGMDRGHRRRVKDQSKSDPATEARGAEDDPGVPHGLGRGRAGPGVYDTGGPDGTGATANRVVAPRRAGPRGGETVGEVSPDDEVAGQIEDDPVEGSVDTPSDSERG